MRQIIAITLIILAGVLVIMIGGYFLFFNNAKTPSQTVVPPNTSVGVVSGNGSGEIKTNIIEEIIRDFKKVPSDDLPSNYFVPLNDLIKAF